MTVKLFKTVTHNFRLEDLPFELAANARLKYGVSTILLGLGVVLLLLAAVWDIQVPHRRTGTPWFSVAWLSPVCFALAIYSYVFVSSRVRVDVDGISVISITGTKRYLWHDIARTTVVRVDSGRAAFAMIQVFFKAGVAKGMPRRKSSENSVGGPGGEAADAEIRLEGRLRTDKETLTSLLQVLNKARERYSG